MDTPQRDDEKSTDPQAEKVARLLDALPGLVGGIDRAIIDNSGMKAPFVLMIFAEGSALHATNMSPPQQAQAALKAVVAAWDETPPEATEL